MAGAWISAWSATSLSRVPAYPFRLRTCAAASRIRSLVRADLEPPSSVAATSCFLGTRQIIGSRPTLTRPGQPFCLALTSCRGNVFISCKILAAKQLCGQHAGGAAASRSAASPARLGALTALPARLGQRCRRGNRDTHPPTPPSTPRKAGPGLSAAGEHSYV